VIKSRRLTWVGHVARIGWMRKSCKAMSGKPERRDHSKVLGVDGRIILKLILGK